MVSFNDADDFFETMAEGGTAMRFKDIDGIGPKTGQKIQSIRGVNNFSDVADMSADELSDKANISHKRATKAIKAGGGNPNISKRNKNTGSVSAAGIKRPVGDFLIEAGDQDKARAKNDTFSRSEEAIRQDERKRAPITTDPDKWAKNKSKLDFPGVDTPTQDPKAKPKDYKAGDPRTTQVDEETEVVGNPGFDERRFMREIDGEEEYAESVVEETPSGFGGVASAFDVSLSPDEAFRGVGATSSRAIGGNFLTEGERKPGTEPPAPPEWALEAQSRGEVADIPDFPSVEEENASAELVEDFNSGLINMREFADQLDDINS